MQQATVKFSKEFITPSGLKEWVGIEWPVDADRGYQGVCDALDEVKGYLLTWHGKDRQAAPQQMQGPGPTGAPVINRAHERLLILIENAETIEELKGHFDRVKDFDTEAISNAFYIKYGKLSQ